MATLNYPTADKIIEYNVLALAVIQVKKKDKPASKGVVSGLEKFLHLIKGHERLLRAIGEL